MPFQWKRQAYRQRFMELEQRITYKNPGHSDQLAHGSWAKKTLSNFSLFGSAAGVSGPDSGRVKAAVSSIQAVHRLQPLPKIQTYRGRGVGQTGSYTFSKGAGSIRVDTNDPTSGFTAAHEIGHMLDREKFGGGNKFGSVHDPKLAPLRKAMDSSRAVRSLQSARTSGKIQLSLMTAVHAPPTYFNYLCDRREIFARAYAQYIATRSRNPQLRLQLRARQKSLIPIQWPDRDFEPIAKEFDRLLAGA